ncbi:unnamed protein product [Paramecium sonneborni]|uniref:J domain-containing protein n=1 Tax=Paramecium sonneborni TaxID=65129 RepID=A0A8S1R9T0_9CILI|nr:unnamed protein product [Paramecium sonneborni]
MTHVLYFGKTLANLQTESLGSQQQILTLKQQTLFEIQVHNQIKKMIVIDCLSVNNIFQQIMLSYLKSYRFPSPKQLFRYKFRYDPDLNKKSDIKERFTQINQAYNQLKQRKFHKKVEEERQFDKISSAQSVEEFNDKYFDSTL